MRLFQIGRRSYAKSMHTTRPGELMLVPDLAWCFQAPKEFRREWHISGVCFVEATWRIRDGSNRTLADFTVTAQAYDRKTMLFAERQHARRLGREICEERGIRWRA